MFCQGAGLRLDGVSRPQPRIQPADGIRFCDVEDGNPCLISVLEILMTSPNLRKQLKNTSTIAIRLSLR